MTKNKIPFKYAAALSILREDRAALILDLGTVKKKINHMQYLLKNEPDDFRYFYWQSSYGGSVSTLTKQRNQWLKDYKDIEDAIKLLKEEGQKDHERRFQLAQAEERFKQEGSYNCLGGC
jgi:hypothetical protein